MLNVKGSYFHNIYYIKLKGELTKETVHVLNKKVTNLVILNRINKIIFNLTDLKYIDMKGINTLFYNYELCKNNSGNSYLYGINNNIRRKLERKRLIKYMHEISIKG